MPRRSCQALGFQQCWSLLRETLTFVDYQDHRSLKCIAAPSRCWQGYARGCRCLPPLQAAPVRQRSSAGLLAMAPEWRQKLEASLNNNKKLPYGKVDIAYVAGAYLKLHVCIPLVHPPVQFRQIR